MINLKSIDKRVQNTLLEKQRELSDHNPKGSGTIFSRSVWARVSTLFNGKLVSFFSDKDPTNINDSSQIPCMHFIVLIIQIKYIREKYEH